MLKTRRKASGSSSRPVKEIKHVQGRGFGMQTATETDRFFLYLQKVLDGFDGTDFAYLTVFITSVNSIGLLIILPILSHKLKLHDSAIQFWVLSIECIGMYSKLFLHYPLSSILST